MDIRWCVSVYEGVRRRRNWRIRKRKKKSWEKEERRMAGRAFLFFWEARGKKFVLTVDLRLEGASAHFRCAWTATAKIINKNVADAHSWDWSANSALFSPIRWEFQAHRYLRTASVFECPNESLPQFWNLLVIGDQLSPSESRVLCTLSVGANRLVCWLANTKGGRSCYPFRCFRAWIEKNPSFLSPAIGPYIWKTNDRWK